jgi:ribosomal protein S18 acetylase RimI-like enzyme
MIHIRPALLDDLQLISSLLPDARSRDLQALIVPRHGATLLAHAGDQPAAIGRALRWKLGAEICDLAVLPAYRRRGIASALIRALLGWCADQNAAYVELTCTLDNAAALGLYQRFQFVPVRTLHIDSQPHMLLRLESLVLQDFRRD